MPRLGVLRKRQKKKCMRMTTAGGVLRPRARCATARIWPSEHHMRPHGSGIQYHTLPTQPGVRWLRTRGCTCTPLYFIHRVAASRSPHIITLAGRLPVRCPELRPPRRPRRAVPCCRAEARCRIPREHRHLAWPPSRTPRMTHSCPQRSEPSVASALAMCVDGKGEHPPPLTGLARFARQAVSLEQQLHALAFRRILQLLLGRGVEEVVPQTVHNCPNGGVMGC